MRQLVLDVLPDSKGLIHITGKDFHYMRQVLRLVPGDMVKVNASGTNLNMTVCSVDDRNKTISLQKCDVPENQEKDSGAASSIQEIYLFQIIPKPQKMELIVRQAVECGVKAIIPVIGEYTQSGTEKVLTRKTGSDKDKNDRFTRIIREARQQSGSPIDTELRPPVKLEEAVSIWQKEIGSSENLSVMLYERNDETETLGEILSKKKFSTDKKNIKLAVFVGCEGGISPEEFHRLKEAGFKAVHFNVNILRCETAALYGIAAVQTAAGDFVNVN